MNLSRPTVHNGFVSGVLVAGGCGTQMAIPASSGTHTLHFQSPSSRFSCDRPPFITTVTRGRFLPSKFDLMVERSIFTFSSRPRPVGLVPRHQCSLSKSRRDSNNKIPNNIQTNPPRGVHDYFNVMWDPHVHRGTTATTRTFHDNESGDTMENPSEPKVRKKRGTHSRATKTKISGSTSSYRVTTTARLTPPPIPGRRHLPIQTEHFLEELSPNPDVEEIDAVVQTDPLYDAPFPSPTSATGSFGVDAYTQVNPEELFDFEEEIQPVLKTLVAKILEQSLLETMEEEELNALKEQQNRFHQIRRQEQRELRLLQEQQERILAEKERFRKHLEAEQRKSKIVDGDGDPSALSDRPEGDEPMFTTSILLELLPSVLNSLRNEGFLTNNINDGGVTMDYPQPFDGDRNQKELEDVALEQ